MKRYLSIYWSILRINWSYLIVYRTNFLTSVFSSIFWAIFSIISIYLITFRSPVIYGIKREDLMMMTALYSIFIGVYHILFSKNFERFSKLMYFGEFDQILIKPVDAQFLISVWLVNFTSFIRVVIGIIFVAVLLHTQNRSVTPFAVVMSSIVICVGLMLLYTLWMIASTLSIWFPRLSNITELMYSVSGVSRYPKNMFRQISDVFFSLTLPISLLMFVPMNILVGKMNSMDIMLLGIYMIVFAIFSRVFWTHSLRHYTSASS